MESILTSIKKLLGVPEDYTHFDTDLIIHINSVFFVLYQIGVGPEKPFTITDNTTTWNEFLPINNVYFESVKTYVYCKVRMVFDPPQSSSVAEAMKQTISELEWRLNVEAETGGKEEIQNGTIR